MNPSHPGALRAVAAAPHAVLPSRPVPGFLSGKPPAGVVAAWAGTMVLLAAGSVSAQVFVFEPGARIPDGTGAGWVDTRSVEGVGTGVAPRVGLSFVGEGAGMINGDLYVTLGHENPAGGVDAFAVLVNRPGKRAGDEDGYRDNGMTITLTPDPAAPDLHTYRRTVTGSDTLPLGGPLTGVWGPDGRRVDPDLVLDVDPRTTALADFGVVDANAGRWVLYVEDRVPGGVARLESWSLEFVPVPEPEMWTLATALGLGLGVGWRRWASARFRTAPGGTYPERRL